jgi:hypothetical protein
MAALAGADPAKNLRYLVRVDRPARKSRRACRSVQPTGRIWIRFTDPASGRIAESVNQT